MKLLLMMLVLLSLGSYAQDGAKNAKPNKPDPKAKGERKLDPKQLQQLKSMSLQNIERRITLLNKTKSCIQKASDAKALRACRQEQKQGMMNLMKEHRLKNRQEIKGPQKQSSKS